MPVLRLRPWPFGYDEKVRLYWLCSPYKTASGMWLLRAVFLNNDQSSPKFIEYPWGTLPALRIGRTYIDGLLEKDASENAPQRVFIPNIQNGLLCKAFDLPKSLYNFYQNSLLGRERLWMFRAKQTVFYIPCLELARAFLAPSKTLANQLMKPHGLDSLIEEEQLQGDALSIHLSGIVPRSLVNDRTVAHIIWLYYEETARECWESIYREIFSEAIQISPVQPTTGLSKGIPVSIKPPVRGHCELRFRGIFYKHFCLILEILKADTSTNFPFSKVVYTHPSLKEKGSGTGSKTPRTIPLEEQDQLDLDATSRPAKNESYQSLIETDITAMGFSNLPSFARETQEASSSESSIPVVIDSSRIYVKSGERIVSTNEPYYGGEVRPIEFVGLHLQPSENINGLEEFLTAIRHIVTNYSQPTIRCSVVEIPGDRAFCHLPDGSRRNCAVVEIIQNGIMPSYILEVARPDQWFISTLFIKVNTVRDIARLIEKEIADLLEETVKRDGHWNVERLEQSPTFKVIRLKHIYEQSPWTWSQRMLARLSIFGFTPKRS